MNSKAFRDLLKAISRADLTPDQRLLIAEALKRPRGRPPKELETVGDYLDPDKGIPPRIEAVVRVLDLQSRGMRYSDALETVAGEVHKSPETVKGWCKNRDIRSFAKGQRVTRGSMVAGQAYSKGMKRFWELIKRAEQLGIQVDPAWRISDLKAEIEKHDPNKG